MTKLRDLRRAMRAGRTRLSFLGLVLFAGLALAQYSPSATSDLGVGFGQAALNSSILQGTRALSGRPGQGTRPPAYKPDSRLAVNFSEARLRQFRQALADQLLKGKSAQQKRAWIAFQADHDIVNGLWVFNAFDKRRPGLPELLATYLGGMWKQVSGTRPDPAKLSALRGQLQRSMLEPAQLAKIKAMSPERRLDWMFSLSYDHDALAYDALFNDDPASRQNRAKLALASAKGNGFDLRRLDLK